MIDDTSLPFRRLGSKQFFYDRAQRVGIAFDRGCQRVAAQRPKTYALHHRPFVYAERHPVVIDHDQRAIAQNDRTLLREIQWNDRNVLAMDVPPYIELGPIGKRTDANALARSLAGVVQTPEFRPLHLRVPVVVCRAERENALLRSRSFFVAPRSTEREIEAVFVERLLKALSFPDVRVRDGAMRE